MRARRPGSMTGRSPRERVDAFYWQGRLRPAKAYLESAQQAMSLAEPAQNGNPIISQIVLAAIAYGDSLTAKRALDTDAVCLRSRRGRLL